MYSIKDISFLITALVLSGVLWFGMLGYRDLTDSDEGRYAQIPAEMVASGDWITPRLNDLKYFEKPVLQYWATAVFYELFGKSNTSARLWTALTGFALALFAAFTALQLYGGRAAIFAFSITISSMMFVVFGHLLNLDMSLSFFLVAAVASLVIAQKPVGSDAWARNWMLLSWGFLALATLTKGPVAVVLAAGTLIFYSIWQRDLALWKNIHLLKGVFLFFLITAPWFIAVSLKNEEFAQFFFIHEHFERYTSEVHDRPGPVYYFIPYLILGLCPWLASSLKSLFAPGFSWMPGNPGEFNANRFLWTFVVFTIVFFSIGQSKLPGYVLPVLPVIAILSSAGLAQIRQVGADRWVLLILGLLILAASFNLERMTTESYPREQWQAYLPWLQAGALFMFAGAAGLIALKNKPVRAYLSAALLTLLAFQCLVLGFNSLSESRSGRVLADVIETSVPSGTPVFSIRAYSESAVFYLNRPVTLVQYLGELEMGIEQEPEKYIETLDEFVQKWQSLDQAALIIKVRTYREFKLESLPGKIVYQGPKRMVIIRS